MTTTHRETATQPEDACEGTAPPVGAPRDQLLAGICVSEKRLHLAGFSTAVLEGGAGAPIVLLHGPGQYAAHWLRIIPELVRSYRVIAPDLPGHGTTESFDSRVDAERMLAWLDELIERTCPTPPILVGQILGGAIAARFAAARRNRLRGLVLSDSLGLAPFQPAPEFGAALVAFVNEPNEENHDRLWQYCAYDLNRLRESMGERWHWLRAYNLDRAQAPRLKAIRLSLMEQFGLRAIASAELTRISVPTILIWGRHDRAIPLQVAEAAAASYGWPLHVIEDAADDSPIEQPEAFLRTLHGALRAVGAAEQKTAQAPAST